MNAISGIMDRSLPGSRLGYWGLLAAVAAALALLFVIGLDQGQMLSAFAGQVAYQQNLLHEIFHDVRHVVGFACH